MLVSPDGRLAIAGSSASGDLRVIALPGGEPFVDLASTGVDAIEGAILGPNGRPAVWGTAAGRTGWFALDDDRVRPLALPEGGVPVWSSAGGWVALARPPGASGAVTILEGDAERIVQVDGSISGLGWAPDGRTLLLLATDTLGVSSLRRVNWGSETAEFLVRNLDAARSNAPIAVSADGRRVYFALASPGARPPAARHRPVADRDLDIYEWISIPAPGRRDPRGRLRARRPRWTPVLDRLIRAAVDRRGPVEGRPRSSSRSGQVAKPRIMNHPLVWLCVALFELTGCQRFGPATTPHLLCVSAFESQKHRAR